MTNKEILKENIRKIVLNKLSKLNEDQIPVQQPIKSETGTETTTDSNQDQVVVDQLKSQMNAIIGGLNTELDKATKGEGGQVNESLLTIASIAIALPAIMGLIARFGKFAGEMVNKVMGKKPTDVNEYQAWLDKLAKIADDLHHLYMLPIQGVVSKFVKDPIKSKKVSSFIFHGIVAVLLLASGVTAVKAFHSKEISLATLESALAAVKSGELQAFISNALK